MKTPSNSRTSITGGLLVAATVVIGFFGSMLDRAVVATPAWRDLGVRAWADYSRHADLGPGYFVYPIGAILAWALVFAAAVAYRRDRSAPRQGRPAIYLAALAALGAVITTIVEAPVMQQVGVTPDDDIAALRRAFDIFTLWGIYVRGICFAAMFICTVWALVAFYRHRPEPTTSQMPRTANRMS
jgi:hypothetical protein